MSFAIHAERGADSGFEGGKGGGLTDVSWSGTKAGSDSRIASSGQENWIFLCALSEAARCTMLYETNQRILATAKCASASLAIPPRLQRTQSVVRKCSASPNYWVSFYHHDYVR